MKTSFDSREVVITGVSIASPAGYTLSENIAAWRLGGALFSPISRFNTTGSSVHFAGECPAPDVSKLPDRKVQKILRRKDVIGLLTAIAAARDAGFDRGAMDPERVGMYVGAGATQIGDLTPYFELVAQCVRLNEGHFDSAAFGDQLMSLVNPLVVLQTLMNNSLCFGTMALDIRGVNGNFMDFQAAGLRAVGEGFLAIREGRADAVLAGGVAGPVEPFQLAEGVHSGYLARTSDLQAPIATVVKPWDSRRQGAVLGEGAAYVFLEEKSHAIRRGAKVLGRIRGFGMATDGRFDFMHERGSPGLARSIAQALDQGAASTSDIGCVIGHANGSVHGDRAEAQAYREVFANHRSVPITSCKSVLGDLGEAGGVVSLIEATDALSDATVAPTFNFSTPDEDAKGLSISAEFQSLRGPCALVTVRNFVGLAAALLLSGPD